MTTPMEDQTPYVVQATLTGTRAVVTTDDAPSAIVTADEGQDLRAMVIEHVSRDARADGRPVELRTTGDRGNVRLLIGVSGDVVRLDAPPSLPTATTLQPTPIEPEAASAPPAPVPLTRREARPSFLTNGGGDAVDTEPPTGWRAIASAFGLKVTPSPEMIQRALDRRLVAQHWSECHKLAVVNLKGGQVKTPTTAMIAAVFARFGGGGVLAWDNSETLGTLGWRTETGSYNTTVQDLVPAVDDLMTKEARQSAIDRYVHHQTQDMYDVLRCSPALFGSESRITAEDFDQMVRVAEKYFRMVVFDSGKDESGERWLRMLAATDQLIIPVLADVESAEGVRTLLEELSARDEHSARLAQDAVVAVSEWPQPVNKTELKAVVDGLSEMVRAVEVVPFDPALKSGALRFGNLQAATQDVYVRIAAHAARGMTR